LNIFVYIAAKPHPQRIPIESPNDPDIRTRTSLGRGKKDDHW
jgi:hypothetical protein